MSYNINFNVEHGKIMAGPFTCLHCKSLSVYKKITEINILLHNQNSIQYNTTHKCDVCGKINDVEKLNNKRLENWRN